MSWGRTKVTGYSTGNASDPATMLFPSQYSRISGKRLVVFSHGWASSFGAWDHQIIDPGAPVMTNLLNALVEAGYPILCPNQDGNTFGNAAAITRLGEAITYAQSNLGVNNGPPIFIGNSMGHIPQCNYAQAHPTSVAAIIGLLPCNDLNDLVINHRKLGSTEFCSVAGTASQTGMLKAAFTTNDVSPNCTTNGTSTVTCATAAAAWVGRQIVGQDMPAGAVVASVVVNTSFTIKVGGVLTAATGSHAGISLTIGGFYDADYGTTYDPARYASATTLPMPQRLYYANDDSVCIPSTVTALQAAIGSSICSVVNLGSVGGHTDASLSGVSTSDIPSWLASKGL